MKKILVTAFVVTLFSSCGGSNENTSKSEDKTTNPDYQKGLDAINRTPICATCHKIDETINGPAWREVANKYADRQDTAFNYLVNKVLNGGTGVWGEAYMPPNSAVPKEDVEAIVKYIFLLKNK